MELILIEVVSNNRYHIILLKFTTTYAMFPLLYDERGGQPRCFLIHLAENIPKLPSQLFLAINMFTCCCLVVMHLFILYITGNKLKHPSECTILKVVLKIVLGGHAPESTLQRITPLVLAWPILAPRPSLYSVKTLSISTLTESIVSL